MQSSKRTFILLILIALVFAYGIRHLFVLRYRAGDVYPVYSSLRADPLGTKALYESLGRCRHIEVERNYDDLGTLDPGPDTAVLWLGDTIQSHEQIDGHTIGMLNGFVRRGGRLVFVFLPTNRAKRTKPTQTKNTGKNTKADKAPPPT